MKSPLKLLSEESSRRRALIKARNSVNGAFSDLDYYVEQPEEKALESARRHAEDTRHNLRTALKLFEEFIAEEEPTS